jgi:arylsulfatase A-like enzyme
VAASRPVRYSLPSVSGHFSNRCIRAFLAAAFAALVPAWNSGCSRPPAPPPCPDCNVVLISVDTLRADHVGAYGYDRPITPSIDALARRGVLFENAISQSSWTRPAHMSIFTGLHPREHGFVSIRDTRALESTVPTLASVFARNGWATVAFTGGINMAASFGFGNGFETYRHNGRSFRDNFEDARFWLDRNQHRKFFLFFHGYDAHTPYRGDSIDRRALGLSEMPRSSMKRACRKGRPSKKMAAYVNEYDAAVRRADRYVGKFLAELDERGLAGRTIVVLLSDHGEEFLEHGRCFHISTLYARIRAQTRARRGSGVGIDRADADGSHGNRPASVPGHVAGAGRRRVPARDPERVQRDRESQAERRRRSGAFADERPREDDRLRRDRKSGLLRPSARSGRAASDRTGIDRRFLEE